MTTEASGEIELMSRFHEALAERLASLNAGISVDGEEVMARLIAELDCCDQPWA